MTVKGTQETVKQGEETQATKSEDSEKQNINRRGRQMGREGSRRDKEGTILDKGDIARDAKATRNRIVTPVALVLRTIAKKHTRNRLSRELSPLSCGKDITQVAKHTQVSVTGSAREQNLTRTAAPKKNVGLKVNEIDGGGNSLSTEVEMGSSED